MANRSKVISIILFLSAFIMLISFGGQRAEWKGTTEEENGIKVINNPREPLYGEIKFELEEDLSIGSEDDDNYMFYRVRDIEVDSQGNIYVADMGNNRIQKFNRSGSYTQTIGRKGQGPGEFERPSKVEIGDKTGRIYVLDGAYRIEIFTKEGNHIKEIHLKKWLSNFIVNEEGNIIGVLRTLTEAEKSNTLCKIDISGEIGETYAKFPYNMFYQRRGEGEIVAITGYEQELLLSSMINLGFVFGYSKEYELYITDNKDKILYKIRKDERYRKFPLTDRKKMKRYGFGDYQPFFYLILADGEGRIYVQRNMAQTGIGPVDRENKEVDVFNRDGYFLYKTSLPPNTYVIKNGLLYAYVVDEKQGLESVMRYKIKNWEQIKVEI